MYNAEKILNFYQLSLENFPEYLSLLQQIEVKINEILKFKIYEIQLQL